MPNRYTNANVVAGQLAPAIQQGGTAIIATREVIVKGAADTDTNVLRFGKVKSSTIIKELSFTVSAMTGCTDVDAGLYAENSGLEVDKDILADGITFASAATLNGLVTVALANRGKALWELLGLANDPQREYDIALTLNTGGTATGTIVCDMEVYAG